MKNILLPLAVLMSVAVGCGETQKEETHDPGLEMLSQTSFNANYEIFIEHKPLIKGVTSSITLFITDLESYKPLSAESIEVSIASDGKKYISQYVEQSVDGSFSLTVNPSQSGTETLTIIHNNKEMTSLNIQVFDTKESAHSEDHNELTPSQVSYHKDQLWNIEFATELITETSFNEIIETSGEIKPAPGDEVIISAKSSGIVIFGQEGLVIGKSVSTGSTLFVISNSDISVDNVDTKFQQSKVSLELAKTNYERNQELIQDQIISQKELLDSKAEYENALIDYNLHAKNYSSGGIKVSNSIDGYLKNLLVSEGQYVEVGTPLAVVSQNKKLIIEADLTQQHFSKIQSINSASFKMSGSEIVYHSDSLNGTIFSVGTSIDPDHPFIPLSIEVDNVGQLISGAMLEVYLKSSTIENVLIIPTSAILEEQGVLSIFVQIDGETFEKREVTLGATDGEMTIVTSGISNAERVVTKGVYQLKLAMSSGSLPAHTHEH